MACPAVEQSVDSVKQTFHQIWHQTFPLMCPDCLAHSKQKPSCLALIAHTTRSPAQPSPTAPHPSFIKTAILLLLIVVRRRWARVASKRESPLTLILVPLKLSESVLIGGITGGAKGTTYDGKYICALYTLDTTQSQTCESTITSMFFPSLGSVGLISAAAIIGFLFLHITDVRIGYLVFPSIDGRKTVFAATVANTFLSFGVFVTISVEFLVTCMSMRLSCSEEFPWISKGSVKLGPAQVAAVFALFAWLQWISVAYRMGHEMETSGVERYKPLLPKNDPCEYPPAYDAETPLAFWQNDSIPQSKVWQLARDHVKWLNRSTPSPPHPSQTLLVVQPKWERMRVAIDRARSCGRIWDRVEF
ncbi:hypothetical protein BDK51DRAFT_28460 [Blyttiomyces helicus]|uniref:Uncharacterized protein n=1 Tax=Blyttiomyces helicus TaxID=388810 RepID=A0A4P9WM01_9FUNG|nr:hypothetical protein BDK51DRAFT_28460 [Blyttiomyces helicus]|eukprot:RKO94091.1 hypothetical protein BDK51DRAFT_28460 [Blyttiomyces helicus]